MWGKRTLKKRYSMVRKNPMRKSSEIAAVLTDVWMPIPPRAAESNFNKDPGDSSEFRLSTRKHGHPHNFEG